MDGTDLLALNEPHEALDPEPPMRPDDGALWDTGVYDPIQVEFLQAVDYWRGEL